MTARPASTRSSRPASIRPMRAYLALAMLLPIAAVFALRPQMLFGRYLRVVRRMRVPEDPGERIASYPLA